MTDEQMRAAFERWLNPGSHDGNVSRWVEPGRYEKELHQLAWLAWKEASTQVTCTITDANREKFKQLVAEWHSPGGLMDGSFI